MSCCPGAAPGAKESAGGTERSSLLGSGQAADRLFELLTTKQRVFISLLLLTSFVLNIICLSALTPFVDIDADPPLDSFVRTGKYGLIATLNLVAERHLWGLYVLILVFSIIFPLVKLALIVVVLALRLKWSTRECVLRWLGHLGRGSLMDVYIGLLLLMITSGQGLSITVGGVTVFVANLRTNPEYGLYLFHAGIICSMASVTWLQELNHDTHIPTKPLPRPPASLILTAGMQGYAMLALCAAALIVQICSVSLPAFTVWGVKVNQDVESSPILPLRPIEHGLAASIYELPPLFAVDMTIFLLIMPIVSVFFCLFVLIAPVQPARWCHVTIVYLCDWSMLDIFAFAYVAYLLQEAHLVELDLQSGSYFLFVYPFIEGAAMLASEYVVRRNVELQLSASQQSSTVDSKA
eukprot:CAMPEP_0113268652 /NCGR_PEP_ID=MMETSP0008_2-20120614/21290_1 /TAXON_ID=97485 /ORGANISM="Prymnesium parvum" /LENGTH=408 /DNA_ID=CAMNT_0000117833 /DNA_START=19 /DNA_END=1245 /DNA_ORIENTATION=+ /assembly_acc=CAM_ASM_000153